MCGICGQFNFGNRARVSPEALVMMTSALRHRGPDDEGYYLGGAVGLGFRRLSIIDLSGGHQPMADSGKSVWVVFNGEIYNFHELKHELQGFGHVFRTKSDTEVIIYGYKQWGEDVLNHLNGMFGVAIWDERNRKLLLARDRMGIKPLYYRLAADAVTFGSEIRAIIAADRRPLEIDSEALSLFLQHRYVPSPFSILKDVRKLAAGTCLILQERQAPRIQRWWNFAPVPFDPMPSDQEATEHLLTLYRTAVRRQLVSDVPLGLLLSGGLDSGLLLALMNESGGSSKTFTVGYGNSYADDELSDAAQTARYFGSPNVGVRLNRQIFEGTLDNVAGILEEPVTASSIVPMYHLCRRTREHVKVALMGQGPDELLGGYTRHLGARYGHLWRALPLALRDAVGFFLKPLSYNEAVKRALYSLDVPDRLERYERILSIVSLETMRDLFHDGVLPKDGPSIRDVWMEDLAPLIRDVDELGGMQFFEVRSSLPDELLSYADKISMAAGLEVRVPYLDQDVVEYVERLSSSFKVRHARRKWLHRKVANSFLPPAVLHRKKRGFLSDVEGWFRESMSTKMGTLLRDPNSVIYGYLRYSSVRRLMQEHQQGISNNSKILFSLVMLEQTTRLYTEHHEVMYPLTEAQNSLLMLHSKESN